MNISKSLRRILYVAGGLLATILLLIFALAFFRISIDLSKYKGPVETAATLALGRDVKIDKKVAITTSLQPIFTLEGLRIGNPKGFKAGDFVHMKTAKVEVRLLPLLLRKIHIAVFMVEGFSVKLAENEKGAVNWTFGSLSVKPAEKPPEQKQQEQERSLQLTSDSLVLTKLVLKDISVEYTRPDMSEPAQFKIETCMGAMKAGKPFTLSMKGALRKQPYTMTIEVGSLEEFLKESRSWLTIKTDIASTQFEFAGAMDLAHASKHFQVKTSVKGTNLDNLNGLLHVDLPPLKSYEAGGLLTMENNRLDLSDFVIQVGKSKLVGKMAIDNTGPKPKASVDLSAPMVQLDDFDVGDWSAEKAGKDETVQSKDEKEQTAPKAKKEVATAEDAVHDKEVESLLSSEVLSRFDVQINVTAQKVMSGTDDLGSGSLKAALKEGRFSIDPVKLNIPGGSFVFATSIKPDREASEASVRAVMENFDFGVLVRRANPEANMGGIINLDVELKSTASSFDELMANSSGHFDFSGRLENLGAGIIDLWAVNLIAAIVTREGEEKSQINCVIGRWTMEDGLLTPEVFLIDTTKIRICGKGKIDFKEKQIDIGVAPTPKKPEFFSLATPVEVKGSFKEFDLGIQAGGLIGTVVKFVTSPVHVPIRRMATKDLPADGADVCDMPIGQAARSAEAPSGC